MSKHVSSPLPLARRLQFIVNQLPDELVIYNLDSNRAHSLNESAAASWNLCAGQASVAHAPKLPPAGLQVQHARLRPNAAQGSAVTTIRAVNDARPRTYSN